MKKLLLSLGAIASVAAPVAAVVACGSTDGSTTGFKEATTEQKAALHNLATTIQGHSSLSVDADTLTKTEVNGLIVRFTFTPASDIDSPRVITVSLETGEITKVQNELNGSLHDNTKSISGLGSLNLSMKQDFATAKNALDDANKATATTVADTFDDEVAAYQALQVMAYGAPTIGIAVPVTGVTWAFSSATVIENNVSKNNRTLDKTVEADKTIAAGLLTKTKTVYGDVKATFSKIEQKVQGTSTTLSAVDQAIVSSTAAIEQLETGTMTYADAETAITAAINSILSDTPAITGVSKLETLGDVTVKSGTTLSADESNLIKVGLPLLLKLSKTVSGLEAFA